MLTRLATQEFRADAILFLEIGEKFARASPHWAQRLGASTCMTNDSAHAAQIIVRREQ
jgi:hypothetical protein